MRMFMLALLMLVMAPATARDATDVEDAWNKLQLLSQGEPADAVAHAKSHGMDLADIVSLQRYVKESQERLTGLSHDFWSDLAKNCAEYRADQEKLLKRWELYVRDKAAMKQSIIDELPEIIGQEAAAGFVGFVTHSKRSLTAGFDATDMRSNDFMRERMITRACEEGEQP